ncbi:MAG: hypothetical protein QOI71_2813 [Gaiellales bacterium]|nr:hypothetical protein [Gaiellales bacterium]
MTRLHSLYKARGVPSKMPICAICLDRTRGKTRERQLTYGVRIWLCEVHHSVEFMRSNAGRDFVVTLMRIWSAQGCLTRARSKALDSHLNAVRATGGWSGGAFRARMRGPGYGPKPSARSPLATVSSRRSPRCVSVTPATTRPFPASARCDDGSPRAAGCDLRVVRLPAEPREPQPLR